VSEYSLAIIGSGGGAFAAAIHARTQGASVVMIERATIGGTCVNVGCVPSKTLLAAAEAYHTAAAHPFAGLPRHTEPVDVAALIAQKDELLAGMRQAKYVDLAEHYGFEVIHGEARFLDADHLVVDGRTITARSYLIATGAEPAIPDLPGLHEAGYLTSTTAMDQTVVPKRLITIGGGFVGLEQGQLFARLGSEVTIIGRLAPRAEPELAIRLRGIFLDEGIHVVGERAATVETRGTTKVVHTVDGNIVEGDAILVATGRRASVDGVDLDAARVKRDEHGFVITDDELRTSNPRVFAAGDVTSGPQFVYLAATQGHAAADNALNASHQKVDSRGLPSVIFTSPALAGAGMTEAEALAAGYQCDCRSLDLTHVPRAIVNHDTRGAIKLVADHTTGRVLGVHALADGARATSSWPASTPSSTASPSPTLPPPGRRT
jgi:mercuric reductase